MRVKGVARRRERGHLEVLTSNPCRFSTMQVGLAASTVLLVIVFLNRGCVSHAKPCILLFPQEGFGSKRYERDYAELDHSMTVDFSDLSV